MSKIITSIVKLLLVVAIIGVSINWFKDFRKYEGQSAEQWAGEYYETYDMYNDAISNYENLRECVEVTVNRIDAQSSTSSSVNDRTLNGMSRTEFLRDAFNSGVLDVDELNKAAEFFDLMTDYDPGKPKYTSKNVITEFEKCL